MDKAGLKIKDATTPATFYLHSSYAPFSPAKYTLIAEKEGYAKDQYVIRTTLNPWTIPEIAIIYTAPLFLVDMGTGYAWDIRNTVIDFDLKPIGPINNTDQVSTLMSSSMNNYPVKSSVSSIENNQLSPPSWEKESIAVADLTSEVLAPTEARTLTEKLHSVLVQTEYFSVLSRSEMQEILKIQEFQSAVSCDDSSCLVEMGKILMVQKVIGGSIGKVGTTYSLSLRIVDVETGKTEFSVNEDFRGDTDELLRMIKDSVFRIAQNYGIRKSAP